MLHSFSPPKKKEECTPERASELTQSILNMIVQDMRPIAIVEGAGFREMIKIFHPGYLLPSRHRFTDLMEEKYKATLEKNANSKITLTTDCWTSVATEAYLGVTCHFLNEKRMFTSYILTTMPLEERHEAENIAAWLEKVVEKMGISFSRDILAVVHDNAANIVAALRILNERYGVASHRCAGHTLQLVIGRALKKDPQINKTTGAARSLVEHFKKSELASSKLKSKQKSMGVDENKLIQDVSTCWNSTYYMVSRLLEQRWPVTAVLSDPDITKRGKHYLDLKTGQWALLEELEVALKPFEEATTFLSAEIYVTVSTLPRLVKGLQKSTQNRSFECAPINSFQAAAEEQIASRWTRETTFTEEDGPNVCVLATALDPRYCKLSFLSPSEIQKVQAELLVLAREARRRKKERLQAGMEQGASGSASDQPGGKVPFRGKKSLLDTLMDSDSDDSSNDNEDGQEHEGEMLRKEVQMYFEQQSLKKNKSLSPLQWWRDNEEKFPSLALLARSYLAVPSTSTPSERLFSAAENIVTKKKSKPDT